VRARSATAVLAAAVGLGLLTGRFVLPARSPAPAAPTAAPTTAPSLASTGSALPKAATGPLTEQNLLAAAEFEAVGISRRIYIRDRVGDGSYANAACAGEKTLGETLGGPGAHFRGLVTTTRTDPADPTLAVDNGGQVAREVAADALSQALAQNYTERLLLEEVPCQDEPAGHWVYGPTRTLDVAPGIVASWMGTYQGDLNTAGAAPQDKEPCGGIAVLRSGTHYAFLQDDACLDTAATTRIVRAAVTRL
jgi:hypothetical protein